MTPGSDRTSELLEDLDIEEQGEEDEGFVDTLGEEAIVESLVPPVAPDAAQPPSAPPLVSTQLPSAQGPSAPVMLPAAQLPSAQGPPAPVMLPAAQLPSAQGPPAPVLPAAQLPSGPLLDAQGPPGHVPSATVDGHGVPGLDRVDELAEYLVELRSQSSLTMTNQQVATIICLWQNLEQFDKDRVTYAARHQPRLVTGSFRSPKKKAVFTPGVDSTKRCVLGSSGSPAQWPNCCRLVEKIFLRLSNIYRSPKKQGTVSVSRWDLILRDYRRIRQLILSNVIVMQQTALQLVEALMTWHNERLKAQEVSVLMQGLQLPVARPVTLDTLPPARVQPVAPPNYSHQLHHYNMPANTAGQAKTKLRKIRPSPSATSAPKAPQLYKLLPKPAHVGSVPTALLHTTVAISPVPSPPAESTLKRKYTRTVTTNLCRKCGQFRTGETGHSQYKGKMYCPKTETKSKEEWLRKMRQL
ncbi:hypothetical protein COCON_G00234370 [Conger conger]|uniref:Uncharacterized protein n=1 Tax=Conger conger TaxID=82655 RepID=A0A9Q1HMN4_CONCO|nr:hypothetical protein COCON_G00234370 [Conger conger]